MQEEKMNVVKICKKETTIKAATAEPTPEKLPLTIRSRMQADEGSNPPFVHRNPARDKAEACLRETEQKLVRAEARANVAVEVRSKKAVEAQAAKERLSVAEMAYVQGCNTLERLTEEYSETRFEVEIALAHAEAELVDANDLCNRVLREMKMAEDQADSALMTMRQAEMDHESAVQRLARMLSKGEWRSGQEENSYSTIKNADASSTMISVSQSTPVRTARPSIHDASFSAARVELVAHGIAVDSDMSESMIEGLLEVVRNKSQAEKTGDSPSKGGAGKTAAHNMSVRLMGFGKAATVLGHDAAAFFGAPTDTRMLLQAVKSGTPVSLACSDRHALLVTDGGEVLAWGEDACGRLGGGPGLQGVSKGRQSIPRPVAGLQGVTVTKVACSVNHSLALTIDGDLYAWGSAANGLLGLAPERVAKLPTDDPSNTPYSPRAIKVEGFNGPLTKERVRDMTCGPSFSIACTVGGLTYSWGSAWAGCLGIGDTELKGGRGSKVLEIPTQIEALLGQKVAQVAAGTSHVLALTDTCNVWAWGSAEFGKLGLGDVSSLPTDSHGLVHAPLPMHIEDLHRKHVVQLAAGATHSLAVTRDGVVYSWGSSEYGKLGHGPLPDINDEEGVLMTNHTTSWWPFCPTPKVVNGLRGRPISKVSCSEFHSLAATIDGEVLAWGLSSDGRLGIESCGEGAEIEQAALLAHLSLTSDGQGMQANLPVAVDNLPWGHVQIATSRYTYERENV